MPASVTATLLPGGKLISRAAAVALTTDIASLDAVTINHGLGRSPHFVWCVARSVVTAISGHINVANVQGWNASTATVRLPSVGAGPTIMIVDVICEYVHTFVR